MCHTEVRVKHLCDPSYRPHYYYNYGLDDPVYLIHDRTLHVHL